MEKSNKIALVNKGLVAKNGLYKLEVIKASSLGSLTYKFNGNGQDKKNNDQFFTALDVDVLDSKGKPSKEIDVLIVGYQIVNCTDFYLFSNDHRDVDMWCELLFLNSNNVVSSLFLKGHSLQNLQKFIMKLQLSGDTVKSPSEVITKIKAIQMDSPKYGIYYVIDFEEAKEAPLENVLNELESLFEEGSQIGEAVLKNSYRFPNSVRIIKRTV